MPSKNPYLRAQNIRETPDGARVGPDVTPVAAIRARSASLTADQKRQMVQNALDNAPVTPDSPSLSNAAKYTVDPERYAKGERAAAEHAQDYNLMAGNALSFVQATVFPGFPSLALLGQLAEYRSMHERLADECVRAWGKVTSTGGADDNKLIELTAELKRIDLRGVVRTLIVQDQAFGRAHALIKLKDDEKKLDLPLVLKPYTIKKGSLEGLRTVEAYWVTPNNYNSIDPSKPDFYKPSSWWMLGQEAHSTRLYTMVSRPVADMLKPAYSFAGVSMSQLAMPYVDNWLRTRQSVSDTVKQFSVSGVRTDMTQMLAPGGVTDLAKRAQLINAYRDNRNLLFLDMATEEFFQVNTPLSGLAELQSQSQEQMAAVSHIPLVILLGLSPEGLNASSAGEIRVFYDYALGYLNAVILPFILYVIQVAQLSLFGEIDNTIGWEWLPLMQETPAEKAERQNKEADTDTKYIEAGVVRTEQVAAKLEADPGSPYARLMAEEDITDLDSTDIDGITEHILAMQPPSGAPPQIASQAGSPVAEPASGSNNLATTITKPRNRRKGN